VRHCGVEAFYILRVFIVSASPWGLAESAGILGVVDRAILLGGKYLGIYGGLNPVEHLIARGYILKVNVLLGPVHL
jgi:hypothetical protein